MPNLKTAAEIASEPNAPSVPGILTAEEVENSHLRKLRAVTLQESGMFETRSDAQTFVDLLAAHAKGAPIVPEMEEFLKEHTRLLQETQALEEKRAAAWARQVELEQLQAAHRKAGEQLRHEQARLEGCVKAGPEWLEVYFGRAVDGAAVGNAGEPFEIAKNILAFREVERITRDFVIPKLEARLSACAAQLAAFGITSGN